MRVRCWLYGSGQRCRSHFEGRAVWMRPSRLISVTVSWHWLLLELITLMNMGREGREHEGCKVKERRGWGRLTFRRRREREMWELQVSCVSVLWSCRADGRAAVRLEEKFRTLRMMELPNETCIKMKLLCARVVSTVPHSFTTTRLCECQQQNRVLSTSCGFSA